MVAASKIKAEKYSVYNRLGFIARLGFRIIPKFNGDCNNQ